MCYNVIAKTFSNKFHHDENLHNEGPLEFIVDNDKVPVHEKTIYNSLGLNQLNIY